MKRSALFFMTLVAFPAFLSAQVTWMASTGVDSASCGSRIAPCASLQQAYTNAQAGTIVKALDAGEFGPASINKAITIDGSGLAHIFGSEPIVIGAGPTDHVIIKNLSIYAPGSTGIAAFGNTQLFLSDVVIYGVATYGISLQASLGATAAIGTLTADHVKVMMPGSVNGLFNNGFNATVRDSVFAYAQNGIQTSPHGATPSATTMVERCDLVLNSVTGAIANGSAAIIRISDSVISNNTTGVAQINGGQVISFRTNMFSNNGTDGTPALSTSLK